MRDLIITPLLQRCLFVIAPADDETFLKADDE
jgi:hypothetical protein